VTFDMIRKSWRLRERHATRVTRNSTRRFDAERDELIQKPESHEDTLIFAQEARKP